MAVASPVRTLLVAHLQATWNRNDRELGKTGRLAMALIMGLLGLAAALPSTLGAGLLGYLLGTRAGDADLFSALLGGLLAFAVLFLGLVGGLSGGSRVLAWESYRIFPLRLRSLFLAELLAGLGDIVPLAASVILACLLLGLGIARPVLITVLPLVWVGAVGSLLCMQHLTGSLTARLVKHLRLGLFTLAALVWVGFVFIPARVERAVSPRGPVIAQGTRQRMSGPITPQQVERVKDALRTARKALDYLPTTQCARGLSEAVQGRWGSALRRQAYPLLCVVFLLLLTSRTLFRESDGAFLKTPVRRGGPERLWSFRSRAGGVARLHWGTLVSSHLGKFGFLIPLITLVILRGPLASARWLQAGMVPAAFGYLALTGFAMQMNQFGLDGPGIKSLLLLPLRGEDLLLGKCLGLACYQGVQAMVLLLLLALGGGLGPLQAAAGLCLAGCLFMMQVSLGHWTSAWIPRTMPRDSLKNTNQSKLVMWLGMLATGVAASWFGGTYLLLARLAPWLLLPGMGLQLAVLVVLYRRLVLPRAAGYLDSRREVLVQALG